MSATLTDIKGLGPSSVQDLSAHGIKSVEDLASVSISDLCAVPGFGEARAARVKAAAAELLAAGDAGATKAPVDDGSPISPAEAPPSKKKAGKGKRSEKEAAEKPKKKDKGKKKDKDKKKKKKTKK